jgi:hypothetical protein
MVSPAPDAWLQHVNVAHSNRVSAGHGLRCPATGFQGQRQLGRNPLHAGISLCRDHSTDGKARQFGAFWRKAGNSQVRKSAWWAREDSNLQPDRYERSALTIELRAQAGCGRQCAPPRLPPIQCRAPSDNAPSPGDSSCVQTDRLARSQRHTRGNRPLAFASRPAADSVMHCLTNRGSNAVGRRSRAGSRTHPATEW